MEQTQNSILCPNCGSTSLYAGQTGYDGNKGAIGTALAGASGVGLGMKGMNTVQITCLACAFVFRPGEGAKSLDELAIKKQQILNEREAEKNSEFVTRIVIALIILVVGFFVYQILYSGF